MSEKYSIVKSGDVNYWIRMDDKIRFQTVGADDEKNAKLLVKALTAYELLPSVVEDLEKVLLYVHKEHLMEDQAIDFEQIIAKLKGLL